MDGVVLRFPLPEIYGRRILDKLLMENGKQMDEQAGGLGFGGYGWGWEGTDLDECSEQ